MLFRFSVALALVVMISLAGTALEKRNLELKRAISRQQYRLEILDRQLVAQRVVAEQLGAPSRLIDQIDPELLAPAQPAPPAQKARKPARQKPQTPPVRSRP